MTVLKIVGLSTSVLGLLALTGCASYKARPLPILHNQNVTHSQNTNDAKFSYKLFTEVDCMDYFDRDIIKAGYQPVQIHIENSSDEDLVFSVQGINMPCATTEEVAKSVHTSTAGRVCAWGIPGLFLWPLLIPAVVDGIGSSEANQQLDVDFAGKSVKGQIIHQNSNLDGVIFVPKRSFKDPFTLTLIGKRTGDKYIFGE
jgi:hypothetical protein